MKRELILMLLSIVSISMMTSLLSGYKKTDTDGVLLDTVNGIVGAGNFSYWQSGYTGPLLIELTSLTGDADLYVSDSVRPSYEVDKNNFSSITCGTDVVQVPNDFPRPIGIGVFGDWSHSISEYSIKVFLDTSMMYKVQMRVVMDNSQHVNSDRSEPPPSNRENFVARKTEEDKPRFLRLINILDMIFEMFVL